MKARTTHLTAVLALLLLSACVPEGKGGPGFTSGSSTSSTGGSLSGGSSDGSSGDHGDAGNAGPSLPEATQVAQTSPAPHGTPHVYRGGAAPEHDAEQGGPQDDRGPSGASPPPVYPALHGDAGGGDAGQDGEAGPAGGSGESGPTTEPPEAEGTQQEQDLEPVYVAEDGLGEGTVSVPEPASWMLMCVAVAGIGATRRFNRKR